MSDPAEKPPERSPVAASRAEREAEFICDALCAGERAILICHRSQGSAHVPEPALGACAGMAARVLHIGPPLPELPELQEMIGTAAGIAGGSGMPPQAMAQMLLSAEPRQRIILAVDEAHGLPRRSLSYLALMIELLATGTPVLQAVLAAGPGLLDTLAQPEFAIFRDRLCRPEFATFQNLQWRKPKNSRQVGTGARVALPPSVRQQVRMPPQRQLGEVSGDRARYAVYAALGGIALSVVAAGSYVILLAFQDSPPPPPNWPASSAPQNFAPAMDQQPAPARLTSRQADGVIEALINELVDAVAQGSFGTGSGDRVSELLARIATLKADASPDGVKLVIDMPNRFAAKAKAATAAGRAEEARRLEYFAAGDSSTAKPDHRVTSNQADRPSLPGRKSMLDASSTDAVAQSRASKDRHRAAGKRSEPRQDAAAPASSNAALDLDAEARPPPERLAKTAPGAIESPSAPAPAGLPAFAPVRVILDVARRDAGWAKRAEDIRQLLVAEGLTIADVVTVDAQWSKPRIGYYFQPDRAAAAGISRRLEPVLGAVGPELLPTRGGIEPGTIEIAVP